MRYTGHWRYYMSRANEDLVFFRPKALIASDYLFVDLLVLMTHPGIEQFFPVFARQRGIVHER